MLPSLTALRAFDAAAQAGSFRAAAEKLSVTPTAISHHIRTLEDQLGTRLFDRTGREVTLTDDGKRLASSTGQAFGLLSETIQSLRKTSHQVVRIAAGPIFAARWLMPRISEFWAAHPGIELEVAPSWRPGVSHEGRADIVVRWERMADAPHGAEKILELNPVAIASPAYLDRYGPIDSPRQLLDRPILHQGNHWGWLDWFAAMGVPTPGPLRGAVFEDANILLRGAADGQGAIVGWLPLIDQDLNEGRVIRLFDEEIPATHAYYVEPFPGRPATTASQRVTRWLVSEAKEG